MRRSLLPSRLGDGSWYVYLSLRDGEGRARIGRTHLTLHPAPALAPLEPEPVLDLGALGTFDDAGVTSSCVVSVAERRYLYYTGWTRGVSVPFYLHVGLAVSENNGPFRRLSRAPLLDRSPADPYLTASPFVRVDSDGWQMWYVSGSEWKATDSGPRHYYNIRYAESMDGVVWRRDGRDVRRLRERDRACVCPSMRDARRRSFSDVVRRQGRTLQNRIRRVGRWHRLVAPGRRGRPRPGRPRMGIRDGRVPVDLRRTRTPIHALQRK